MKYGDKTFRISVLVKLANEKSLTLILPQLQATCSPSLHFGVPILGFESLSALAFQGVIHQPSPAFKCY